MPRDANGNFTPVHNFTTEYNAGQKTIRADYMDEQFTDLASAIASDSTTGVRNSGLVRRNASGKIFGDILGNAATATNATTAATATDLAAGSVLSIGKGGTNASNAGDALTNLGVSAFGQTILDDADAAAARTTLGLGSAAVLTAGTAANNVVQLNASAKLPAVDGSLLTNLHAGGLTGMQVFTSSGTFTVPAGVTAARVICVGGGGGSGGTTTSTQPMIGGSGGGGGYSEKLVTGLTPGGSISVTVGAGGTAGSTTGNGGAGGASSFGSYVTAPGGGGGTAATGACGSGGNPTTSGALNIGGEDGVMLEHPYAMTSASYFLRIGGRSYLAEVSLPYPEPAASGLVAVAGSGIGAGAKGPVRYLTNLAGAAGAAGAVIIQY